MKTTAVVLEKPGEVKLSHFELPVVGADDIAVEINWSGISSGTERLLYTGTMPSFPGMGYPLVPGYESVGTVKQAGQSVEGWQPGDSVFVPGAQCYGEVRGLFGGAASHVIVPARRAIKISQSLSEQGTLLALAATAHRAVAMAGDAGPDLIVGHGVLGRLIARITVALGRPAPTVWENSAERRDGAEGYVVVSSEDDGRKDYTQICDASGDANLLDHLIGRLAKGGQITLAGFYHQRINFSFPPAFMRESTLRISAEWGQEDMSAVLDLIAGGKLSLEHLITNCMQASSAEQAYRTAFDDRSCLKMILDWRAFR